MTGSAVASMAFARLPAHLRPLHYNVRLKPDLVALTFQGWMNVEVEVLRETSEIVCNAAD
jgi:Peptidase family M1.